MSKKISFILLSSILCSSTINGMEKVKGLINPVIGAARTQMDAHPYAFTSGCFATGLVATDALRKFPVGSAMVNGTRAALSAAGSKLATAGTKTKDGFVAAYDVIRHPVEPTKEVAKFVKDTVVAHPYKTGFIGTGVVAAEEEIRRGFPVLAQVKDTTVAYAPKVLDYAKEKGSSALDFTKENAPKIWDFTKTIPSILWAHKVKSGLGVASTAAVVSAIVYRSAISSGVKSGSKAAWSRTVSAWNWLKSNVTRKKTEEAPTEAVSADKSDK
jgi:hypothetical protein